MSTIISTVRTRGLKVLPQDASSDRRIVIIGAAANGPMLEPVDIGSDINAARTLFGDEYSSKLTLAIREALEASNYAALITAVRIGSTKAKAKSYTLKTAGGDIICVISSKYPDEQYSEFTVTYSDGNSVVISDGTDVVTLTYDSAAQTLAELEELIEDHADLGYVNFVPNTQLRTFEGADLDAIEMDADSGDITAAIADLKIGALTKTTNFGVASETGLTTSGFDPYSIDDAYITVPVDIELPENTLTYTLPMGTFAISNTNFDPLVPLDNAGVATVDEFRVNGSEASSGGQLKPATGSEIELTYSSDGTGMTTQADYTVNGNILTFGAALDDDYTIRAMVVVSIKEDVTISASDELNDQIEIPGDVINNIDSQTDWSVAIGEYTNATGYFFGTIGLKLNETYQLSSSSTSTAKAAYIQQNLTPSEKAYDLSQALDAIENIDFSFIVPLEMYLDDTMVKYDHQEGEFDTTNADYQTTLKTFLEDYRGVAVGIMSTKPIEATSASDLASQTAEKLESITTYDVSSPLNLATVLYSFNTIYLMAIAGSYIDARTQRQLDYAPVIAGVASTLNPDDTIYRKGVISSINADQNIEVYKVNGTASEKSQAALMVDNRINPIVEAGGGVKLFNNRLLSASDIDFQWFSSIWVAELIEQITRQILENYLGKKATPQIIESLKSNLKDTYQKYSDYYQELTFDVTFPETTKMIKSLTIPIEFKPYGEIHSGQIIVSQNLE